MTVLLRWVELNEDAPTEGFPWNLLAVRALEHLEFSTPVTFLVGENGIGKSTLVEAIAVAAGFSPGGGTRSLRFESRETESPLHEELTLAWVGKERRSFFLRAETFFNMASAYADVGLEVEDPVAHLHERSHGEQFLDVVRYRFGPGGLFIMDEPESALSFVSQLALMAMMHEFSQEGSQFIVATHSPVLVALPGATILLLDQEGIRPVSPEECPSFRDVKSFVNAPESFLRHLLEA